MSLLRFQCYVRAIRLRWSLTQDELARLLGYKSRSTIWAIEKCEMAPNTESLLALEMIFGKRPEELFPELYDLVEERVARDLYEMQQELTEKGTDTPRTRAKHQLLAEALSRAALRTKRPISYDE